MTRLMQAALAEISKLTETEQDALAAWILDELASESRWSAALAESADALAQFADDALREHRAGRTQPLDPDAL